MQFENLISFIAECRYFSWFATDQSITKVMLYICCLYILIKLGIHRVKKSPRHTDINLPRNDRLPITCKYLWLTLKIQSAEIIFSYSAATQALTP